MQKGEKRLALIVKKSGMIDIELIDREKLPVAR